MKDRNENRALHTFLFLFTVFRRSLARPHFWLAIVTSMVTI